MKNILLIAVALTAAAIAAVAQPTSIRLLSPGRTPGETYRAGNSYDITYDTVGTFRSRFKFQFGTTATGPWTDLLGSTNVIDSNASGQVRRGLVVDPPDANTLIGFGHQVQQTDHGSSCMCVTMAAVVRSGIG